MYILILVRYLLCTNVNKFVVLNITSKTNVISFHIIPTMNVQKEGSYLDNFQFDKKYVIKFETIDRET